MSRLAWMAVLIFIALAIMWMWIGNSDNVITALTAAIAVAAICGSLPTPKPRRKQFYTKWDGSRSHGRSYPIEVGLNAEGWAELLLDNILIVDLCRPARREFLWSKDNSTTVMANCAVHLGMPSLWRWLGIWWHHKGMPDIAAIWATIKRGVRAWFAPCPECTKSPHGECDDCHEARQW